MGNVICTDGLAFAQVFTPDESADFSRTAHRIVIFSDLNVSAILSSVIKEFGRHFEDRHITKLGIYKLC